MGLWWGNWANFIYENGGDFISADGKQFALNKPEAVDALQKIADLINKYHVMPSPVQTQALPGTATALQTGKVAMAIDGQWSLLDVGKAGFNFNLAPLPKLKGKSQTMIVAGAMGIFSSSQHIPEAWTMFKYLIDPTQVKDLITTGLWMPNNKSWYTNPDLLASWAQNNAGHPSGYKNAVLNQMLNNSVPGPTYYVMNYNKILDVVNPAMDKVWLGTTTAQAAMDSIAAQAQALVNGRRPSK